MVGLKSYRSAGWLVAAALAILGLAFRHALAAVVQTGPGVRVSADGTVQMPAMSVPVSEFLSPAARAYLAQHLRSMQDPAQLQQVAGVPVLLRGYLNRQRVLFPVAKTDTRIAGVHVQIYRPLGRGDPANAHRVLIDLHGGGFSGCWPACAELESRPIAALGRIEVISIDYREAPQSRFPAASEDVALVYRKLLESHRPGSIGIYGCSAGGMLTGMALAWFQAHGLPAPGAAGVLCAGLASSRSAQFGGDATYVALPLGEARPAPGPDSRTHFMPVAASYFAGVDPHNPLVSPADSLPVLARFPPTLIVTGTRGFEFSNAVYTHTRLVDAGVDAELHVWEGLFHGFFYNPDVPESMDCYRVIARFFERRLS